MQRLDKSERKLLEQLLSVGQAGLRRAMITFLKKNYQKVFATKEFVCAIGDIPIALVAHMDTVWPKPPEEIFFDEKKQVMWGENGLGADDRAGVFAICSIIRDGYRPHVIFTTDEETGGLGALALSKYECPFDDLRYLIQLDRRGSIDCVFYDCYVQEFTDYIESFGFVEAYGSFSDISTLCPAWQKCGVNLSVGYYNEHTTREILRIGELKDTIAKVENMLSVPIDEIPCHQYYELPYQMYCEDWYGYGGSWNNRGTTADKDYTQFGNQWNLIGSGNIERHCHYCASLESQEAVYPVVNRYGYTSYVCYDCIQKLGWCTECGQAFFPEDVPEVNFGEGIDLCPRCAEDYLIGVVSNNGETKGQN